MQTRTRNPFATIHAVGALLPSDFLQCVRRALNVRNTVSSRNCRPMCLEFMCICQRCNKKAANISGFG